VNGYIGHPKQSCSKSESDERKEDRELVVNPFFPSVRKTSPLKDLVPRRTTVPERHPRYPKYTPSNRERKACTSGYPPGETSTYPPSSYTQNKNQRAESEVVTTEQ